MSYCQRYSIDVVTASDGTATAYSPTFTGKINAIIYTKTDFASGVDFTITAEATGQTLWTESDVNSSKTVAPRQATHSTAGAASLYAATGQPVLDGIAMANDRVKIAIAQGGNAKTGNFIVIVE